MVEKIKNGLDSNGLFDNIKDSISKLKDQIFGKDKEKILEKKKNVVALDELQRNVIDKKLDGLALNQHKFNKIENKSAKIKSDFLLPGNSIYYNYGKNSNNPIDVQRGEEAINLLQNVVNYKDEKNPFANFFGGIANKLLS